MLEIPTLTTERLVLRAFREDDAAAAAGILSTPRVTGQASPVHHPYPVEAALSWIRQHNSWAEQGLHLQWAITYLGDRPIGMVSLDLGGDPPRGDLGYLVEAGHCNRGYATEAVRAVIDYGFDVLELRCVQATCFAINAASIRVLEKCGLVHEATYPAYVDRLGMRHDIVRYGLTHAQRCEISGERR